jgi:hypothetical protein
VDVSGTTNEKGEETEGYDPSNDIGIYLYAIKYLNIYYELFRLVKSGNAFLDI